MLSQEAVSPLSHQELLRPGTQTGRQHTRWQVEAPDSIKEEERLQEEVAPGPQGYTAGSRLGGKGTAVLSQGAWALSLVAVTLDEFVNLCVTQFPPVKEG